jgi:ribosomal protein L7/L12
MTNPLQTTHQVVSMLAGEQKVSLFTAAGSIVDLKHNEDYDTAEIVKYLRANLNGTNQVSLNLADYTKMPALPAITETLEQGGIEVTQIIDGVEVQGIFYPKKAQTVIAIGGEVAEIPGLDNLLRHAKRAKEYGNDAVKAFLTRMMPILQKRKHSAEDLMNFIGNSELPLTLSGQVIAYKRLNKGTDGYWKDPHSGTVKQKVGTIVQMSEFDVDPDRFRSCSNGLHVANRSYFGGGGFSAENTFVVLVNPEDFIAVPQGENGKARVSRYQIIGMLTPSAHGEISHGFVKDSDSLTRLIANAIEGRFVPATEIAHVGKNGYKETIAITEVGTKKIGSASQASLTAARSLDADKEQPKAIPTSTTSDKPMADGAQTVKDITPATIPENVLQAFNMLREGTESKAAIARKLDTSTRSLDRWCDKYNFEAWVKTIDSAVALDAMNETPENLKATEEMFDQLTKEQKEAGSKRLMEAIGNKKPPTRTEIIRGMYTTAKTSDDFKAIITYKKNAKKSWYDLGLTAGEVANITKGAEAPPSMFDLYLITQDRMIQTIKRLREMLGLGLKEAKDLVDSGKLMNNATAANTAQLVKLLTDDGIVTETVLHGAPRPVVKPVEVKSTVQTQTAPLSKAQQARLLFEQKNWAALRQFKKEAKKGWDVLGFNESEIGQITSK